MIPPRAARQPAKVKRLGYAADVCTVRRVLLI
jgi:hypothetical protein